jgi:hypothetical protein
MLLCRAENMSATQQDIMQNAIEVYRGVEIYESLLSLYDSHAIRSGPQLYTARVQEWHLIGNLLLLKEQIDRKLDQVIATGTLR